MQHVHQVMRRGTMVKITGHPTNHAFAAMQQQMFRDQKIPYQCPSQLLGESGIIEEFSDYGVEVGFNKNLSILMPRRCLRVLEEVVDLEEMDDEDLEDMLFS